MQVLTRRLVSMPITRANTLSTKSNFSPNPAHPTQFLTPFSLSKSTQRLSSNHQQRRHVATLTTSSRTTTTSLKQHKYQKYVSSFSHHSTRHTPLPHFTLPIAVGMFPFQQAPVVNDRNKNSDPMILNRDMDIDFYANENNYKKAIQYVDTPDIVVNILQIQRIIMKDAFLCKKYCRYIIETVEDAKRIIEQAEKRLGTMIEITTHEPTNAIYRNYILKLDHESEALDGYLNLGLLCVMPVATITKHFKALIDEDHNDGGLGAEFLLVQDQFDIVHEQLNQLQELSTKCDGLVEISEQCVQTFLKELTNEIENLQENQLPRNLSHYNGQQPLSPIYFDEDGRSTSKYVSEAEIVRVFNEIQDPEKREKELMRIARENRKKAHLVNNSEVVNYRTQIRQDSPVAQKVMRDERDEERKRREARTREAVQEIEDLYDDKGKFAGARVHGEGNNGMSIML